MDVNNHRCQPRIEDDELTLETPLSEMPLAHSVAIVGLGPKGLYCLERLLAEFQARPLRHALHVSVFNRSAHFGASPIYDPEQPEYILVNISVGEIDLWEVDEPPLSRGAGLTFSVGIRKHSSRRRP